MGIEEQKKPETISLVFQAKMNELLSTETALTDFLSQHDFNAIDIHGIFITFHEHSLNIIRHGYPKDKPGPICLDLLVQPVEHGRRVIMTMRDEGHKFNTAKHEATGLGIDLIRSIAKIIEWEYVGKENRTVFIFKVFKTAAENESTSA